MKNCSLRFFQAGVMVFSLLLGNAVLADTNIHWQALDKKFEFDDAGLTAEAAALHRESHYVMPTPENLKTRVESNEKLAKSLTETVDYTALASTLRKGWILYHQGNLQEAYQLADSLGHFGTLLATNAWYLNSYYQEAPKEQRLATFKAMADRVEKALELEPDNASLEFMYCYTLGRYLEEQDFSAGLISDYSRINKIVKGILKDDPEHLGAKLIMASFHADGSVKAPFLSKVRFGSSRKKALKQFSGIMAKNSDSIIANLTYAENLMKYEDDEFDATIKQSLEKAVALTAIDPNSYLAQEKARKLLAQLP